MSIEFGINVRYVSHASYTSPNLHMYIRSYLLSFHRCGCADSLAFEYNAEIFGFKNIRESNVRMRSGRIVVIWSKIKLDPQDAASMAIEVSLDIKYGIMESNEASLNMDIPM